MQWIPAIDIKDRKVVRLKQGLMAQSTVYSDNPLEMAKRWRDDGATRLHIVDLNGAFLGKPINLDIIERIARLDSRLHIQVGGGIRDAASVKRYVESGVRYCILGTLAIKNPALAKSLFRDYRDQLILGIDAKDGHVALEGWAEESRVKAADLAVSYEPYKPAAIIYTDVARDGMLSGPNLPMVEDLADETHIPIFVSGGISSLADLRAIAALKGKGIAGAILGKALYENRFTLKEALAVC